MPSVGICGPRPIWRPCWATRGPITSGVPSTTATTLASLGTGLPPGSHGLVGYTARVPETGEILNALTWESDLPPRVFQPRPTMFERAAAAGVRVTSVGLERFAGSGLTEAALRGAEFSAFANERDEQTRIDLVAEAALAGRRSLVYAYERELDHTGHVKGWESAEWLAQLERVDAFCERLATRWTTTSCLLITGDHGMVDVPSERQMIIEDVPELMAGVSAVAGEGRFRQLYVDDEPVDWRSRRAGPRCWANGPGYGPATRRSRTAGSGRSSPMSANATATCWSPCGLRGQ